MSDAPLAGRRVLVAEDEYLVAIEMAYALQDAGADVAGPVPSVADGLGLLRGAGRIDFAVLDVNLGGEPVYPLADALAERGIPFAFVTGYDADSVPSRYARMGRLEKPIAPGDVVAFIGHALD